MQGTSYIIIYFLSFADVRLRKLADEKDELLAQVHIVFLFDPSVFFLNCLRAAVTSNYVWRFTDQEVENAAGG